LFLFNPGARGQNDSKAAENRKEATNTTNQTPANPSVATHSQHDAETKPTVWHGLTRGEWIMAALTAIYVSITGFYARVSYQTLKAIEKQSEFAKDQAKFGQTQFAAQLEVTRANADAAKASANALVNSERAWVDGVFTRIRGDYDYSLQITNHGRTPAQLLSWEMKTDCRPRVVTGDQQETWSNEMTGNLHILLASHGVQNIGNFEMPNTFFEWNNVLDGSKTGIIRITIKYRDLVTDQSSEPHETAFTYYWDVPHVWLQRISIYNRYT